MLIRLLVLIFIIFAQDVGSAEPHHTTAYINATGSVDTLISYSTYSTKNFWNKDGKKLPSYNHFCSDSYFLYTEYAWNHRTSFFFHGGYSLVKESLNGNSYSFNDIQLGCKSLLYQQEGSAFTSQIIGIVPTGQKKSSIRYGQPGLQASLLYSDSFYLGRRYGWYDLELGYLYYQGFPSDRILANTSIGYEICSSLYIIATSQLDYGVYNGKSKDNLNNIIFHPNYRLLKAQLECVVKIFRSISISVGAYKHIWGMNVGIGGGFFCGTWFDF